MCKRLMPQTQNIVGQFEAARDACASAAIHFGNAAKPRFQLVDAHSNFNYVFKVTVEERCYYLKVAQSYPKTMTNALPRERIFAEANAMKTFREAANGLVDVPAILLVDTDNYCFLMTDVNADGKHNGLDMIRDNYAAYGNVVEKLSHAVGCWHGRSLDNPDGRYQEHAPALRAFIYDYLIEPGIATVVGHKAEVALNQMKDARICLIHSDLWAKNYLIGRTGAIALLDFEGALLGDPAFDVATMLAASLLPVYEYQVSPAEWRETASNLIRGYRRGLSNEPVFESMLSRLGPYLAIMLSARTNGPFPYSMSGNDKADLNRLCGYLVDGCFDTWSGIQDMVMNVSLTSKAECELT